MTNSLPHSLPLHPDLAAPGTASKCSHSFGGLPGYLFPLWMLPGRVERSIPPRRNSLETATARNQFCHTKNPLRASLACSGEDERGSRRLQSPLRSRGVFRPFSAKGLRSPPSTLRLRPPPKLLGSAKGTVYDHICGSDARVRWPVTHGEQESDG